MTMQDSVLAGQVVLLFAERNTGSVKVYNWQTWRILLLALNGGHTLQVRCLRLDKVDF